MPLLKIKSNELPVLLMTEVCLIEENVIHVGTPTLPCGNKEAAYFSRRYCRILQFSQFFSYRLSKLGYTAIRT
jgi:hypothetical protein